MSMATLDHLENGTCRGTDGARFALHAFAVVVRTWSSAAEALPCAFREALLAEDIEGCTKQIGGLFSNANPGRDVCKRFGRDLQKPARIGEMKAEVQTQTVDVTVCKLQII
jgi:hypothetical protein